MTVETTTPEGMQDGLTVFYDGACPICAREISFYKSRSDAHPIDWVDVSREETAEVAPGVTRDSALRRFHVVTSSGEIYSGGSAFAHVWARTPGFRLIGRVFQIKVMARLLDKVYDLFLIMRPWLQDRVT